jgi:hypothetical protein
MISILFIYYLLMQYPEQFLDRLKMSFAVAFKKPLWFIAFPALAYGLMALFSLGAVFGGVLAGLLAFVASIVIFFFLYVGLSRLADKEMKGENPQFGATMNDSLSRFWTFIILSLRTFWYVVWPLFLVIVAVPLVGLVAGSAGSMGVLMDPDLASDPASLQMALMGALGGLGIAFVAIFVLVFGFTVYRSVKTQFGMIAIAVDDMNWRESFATSLAVTNGAWWKSLGNMIGASFVWGLVGAIISGVLTSVVMAVVGDAAMMEVSGMQMLNPESAAGAVVLLLQAVASSLSVGGVVIFMTLLFGTLKKEAAAVQATTKA